MLCAAVGAATFASIGTGNRRPRLNIALAVTSTCPGSASSSAATAWCTSGLRNPCANSTAPGFTMLSGDPIHPHPDPTGSTHGNGGALLVAAPVLSPSVGL